MFYSTRFDYIHIYTFVSVGVRYSFDLQKDNSKSETAKIKITTPKQKDPKTIKIRKTAPKQSSTIKQVNTKTNQNSRGISEAEINYWNMVNEEKINKQKSVDIDPSRYKKEEIETEKEQNDATEKYREMVNNEKVNNSDRFLNDKNNPLISIPIEYKSDTTPVEKIIIADSSKNQNNQPIPYSLTEGDIIVTSEVPLKINPGDTFSVDLTIDKGNYIGGLEIKQTFSDGFIPVIQNSGNAVFVYNVPDVIIRWDNMPPGN